MPVLPTFDMTMHDCDTDASNEENVDDVDDYVGADVDVDYVDAGGCFQTPALQ